MMIIILVLHLIAYLHGACYAFSFDLLTYNKFPFEKFFNLSFNASSWKQSFLCQQESHDTKCCDCDNNCWLRRSCCIDKLWNGDNRSLPKYLDEFTQKAKQYDNKQCRPLLGDIDVLESDIVSMITRCNQKGSFKSCSHGDAAGIQIPVIGSDGNVYQNEYCLRCNGIPKVDNFPVKLICNITGNIMNTTKSLTYSSCVTRFDKTKLRTNTSIQMCTQHFGKRGSCPQNNSHSFLCASYEAKTDNGWKNPHCAICYNVKNQLYEENVCKYNSSFWQENIEDKFGYSVVVSLGGMTGCKPGTIWDANMSRCSSFVCGPSYKKHKSKCIKKVKTHRNLKGNSFNTCLRSGIRSLLLREKTPPWPVDSMYENIVSSAFNYVLNSYYIDESLEAISPNNNSSAQERLKYSFKLLSKENIFISSEPLLKDDLDVVLSHEIRNKFFEYETLQVNITSVNEDNINLIYGFHILRNFPNYRVCNNVSVVDAEEVKFFNNCLIELKNYTYSTEEYKLILSIQPSSVFSLIAICHRFHLQSDCPMDHWNSSMYTVNESTFHVTLLQTASKVELSPEKYLPDKDGIKTCKNTDWKKPEWLMILNSIEYYITIVGISVSLPSYLMIIFTYIYLKELHSLPSFNLVSLCLTLVISDVLLLSINAEVKMKGNFSIVATCLHWLLLSLLIWMCIFSVELLSLTKPAIQRRRNNRRTILRNLTLSILLPSLVVMPLALVDKISSGYVGYGHIPRNDAYGEQPATLIKNRTIMLTTYLFPLVTVTTICCISLMILVVKLKKLKRDTDGAFQDSGRNKAQTTKIALKIFFLLGISELFGVIGIPNPQNQTHYAVNTAFKLIYSILRSFRGMFVFCGYCLREQIKEIYLRKIFERLEKYQKKPRLEGTSNNSTITLTSNEYESKLKIKEPNREFVSDM